MSTDAILDLTAIAAVFGSFIVAANWDRIRNAVLRSHDAPSRSGAVAQFDNRS
jgi:hypothetical protein